MAQLHGQGPIAAAGPTSVFYTTPFPHSPGDRARDNAGNEYLYLKGVASTVVGDWVVYYPNDYTTARALKAEVDKLYPVAVAMAATVASRWGWYQVLGLATAKVAASCVLEVALYTTTTAGVLDDDASGTTKINRVLALTTVTSAGTTPCWIAYPSAG